MRLQIPVVSASYTKDCLFQTRWIEPDQLLKKVFAPLAFDVPVGVAVSGGIDFSILFKQVEYIQKIWPFHLLTMMNVIVN